MFLTIVLFIFIGFWLLGLLFRWILPFLLIRMQKRYAANFNGQNNGNFGESKKNQKREGEVTVETPKSADHKISKNLGDYVEFEEEK